MSNKRPLSPEPITNLPHDNDPRSLKRFKLHSIIQELRNEEANLVLLKKLRTCQQLATRANQTGTTNGFHATATRIPTNKPSTPIPVVSANSSPSPLPSRSSLPQPLPSATRKPTSNAINSPLPTKLPAPLPAKPSSAVQSLEERKTQAKKALRNQLERDLLNIPSPKPLIQDVLFIPNPTSLEFQPYIGLEDVVQCLSELQADRQRLPQRFTDRAQVDEPHVCEHCGTDFTIRWWKHMNNSMQINILCDRCKKQVTRRSAKSEHSALLKNVFVSAMEQEKEIEKTFQTLIKQQQKNAARAPPPPAPVPAPAVPPPAAAVKPVANNRPVAPVVTSNHTQSNNNNNHNHNHNHHHHPHHHHQSHLHHNHQKAKAKSSVPQAQSFATKLSQQPLPIGPPSSGNAVRKSHALIPPPVVAAPHNMRSVPSNKSPMPAHQQYRSASALPQQQPKMNQMVKMSKTAVRQQQPAVSSRPVYPPTSGAVPPSTIHPPMATSANARPTATKRRTLPSVNMK